MENKKEDRRVRITKRAIMESFIELLERYPVAKLSVKKICETADINRSTFYAHYSDQYDLLNKIQQEVMEGLAGRILDISLTKNSQTTIQVLTEILEYAKNNAVVFGALLSEDENSPFRASLMEIVEKKIGEEAGRGDNTSIRAMEYLKTFAVSGYISIIKRWLYDGCVDSPKDLAEIMTKFLFQGVISVYDN